MGTGLPEISSVRRWFSPAAACSEASGHFIPHQSPCPAPNLGRAGGVGDSYVPTLGQSPEPSSPLRINTTSVSTNSWVPRHCARISEFT